MPIGYYRQFYTPKPFEVSVQPCDIGLVLNTNPNPIEAAILSITNGIVNHAFIVVGGNGDLIEALPGGVQKTNIAHYVQSGHSVMIFRKVDLKEEERNIILSYAQSTIGRKYAYADLLHFIYPEIPNDENEDFCTENVSECFEKSSIRIADKDPYNTAPQHILNFMFDWGAFRPGSGSWKLTATRNFNIDKVEDFLNVKENPNDKE